MTKMFGSQLGKSIEIYIDDIVVKSKIISEHVKDLQNIFEVLRKYKLRLNASKCSFGVGLGKFLGYVVTHRGIEVKPDQIKAINNLQAPWNLKEVQKLTGMAAALNRFISRSTDRCRPFFSFINKWKGFEWTEECALAFQQLKDYLARLPIMSSLEPDEVLFAYIVVAPYAVSLVLIRVDQGVQRPVYYVSKSLHEAEVRYLPLEKAILVVVLGTQKLPHYFQEVYVDGASNQKGSSVGSAVISLEKIIIEKSLRLGFTVTNNEAEYEALLMGMTMVQRMGGKNSNAHADSLATLATSSTQDLSRVMLIEDLCKLTETKGEAVQVHQIRAELSWMDPIIKFLKEDVLPEERSEADKVRRKATRFWLSENQKLYKRSYSRPYFLCMHPETAELLLEELHEGICGSYTRGRSITHKAISQGGVLNPLSSPWSFAQWGLDIVGPFPNAARNKKYLLVGTDYFTKWVEAEPLANIRDVDIKKFV
ncbi:uncharacterized protein LOC136063235 [Quercus suber]|uniref:uncharacterized protein LOC136063235 n=1 Tax=Quercus suber TaxID=58331 RepID=UPI0032DFAAD0